MRTANFSDSGDPPTQTSLDRDPPDRDPLESTETPLDRDPLDRRNMGQPDRN